MVIAIDGMRVNNLCGSGQFSGFYMNDASIQEVTFTTGAESAEMQNGGLRINSMPKDGGNTFLGHLLRLRRGQPAAGRQPIGCGEGRRRFRNRASPTPIRSTRRSAVRSSGTSCGSTSPTSTRTTRPTSPAPRSPMAAGRSGRRRATTARSTATDVAGLAARQDPLLPRAAVQRRGLQRLQHAADDVAGSVDRCVRRRLGAADQVDADHHRTSCCSRPASRTTRRRTSRTAARPSDRAISPRLEQTTNRLTVAVRQHHSAVYELDQELQLGGVGQLHHRLARVQGRHDDGLGHQLADVHVERRRSTRWSSTAASSAPAERHGPVPCVALPCPIGVAVTNGPAAASRR